MRGTNTIEAKGKSFCGRERGRGMKKRFGSSLRLDVRL